MTVGVDIPAHLRVDADALQGRSGEIEDALRRAAGRALAASRDAVLADAKGRSPELRLEAPDFVWTGPAAPGLSDELRGETERRLFDALVSAVDDAELEAGAPRGRGPRSRGAPTEPLDPMRHARVLGRYVIPSYAGAAEAIPVDGGGLRAGVRPAAPAAVIGFVVPGPGQVGATLVDWLSAGRVTLDRRRQVGVIFASPGGGYGIHVFRCGRSAEGGLRIDPRSEVEFTVFPHVPVLRPDDIGYVVAEEPAGLSPQDELAFEWLSGDPASAEFRAELHQAASAHVGAAVAPKRDMLVAEIGAEALERFVAEQVEAVAGRIAKGIQGLGRLHAGTETMLIRFRDVLTELDRDRIPLAPVTGEVVVRAEPSDAPERPPAEAPVEPAVEARAEPEAEGAAVPEQRLPGLVEAPIEPPEGPTAEFPVGDEARVLVCAPFEDEPPLSALGDDGVRLHELMAPVAHRLRIVPCDYAGGFTLMAAEALAGRAASIGSFAASSQGAFIRPAPGGTGNLGPVEFVPAPSPAVQYMRHLAGVAPELRALSDETQRVYRKREHVHLFGHPAGGVSWQLRFVPRLNRDMGWAVGVLFGMTCRILLLQLLAASAEAIAARRSNQRYAELFEQVVVPRLRDIEELVDLRDRLREAQVPTPTDILVRAHSAQLSARRPPQPAPTTLSGSEAALEEWRAARRDVADVLTPAPPPATAPDARAGAILLGPDGRAAAIRDSRGRPWTLDVLERGIVMRRGLVEDIDPVVKQLIDLDGVLDEMRAGSVRQVLDRVLGEMAEHNRRQTRLVVESWMYAVRASQITPTLRSESVADSGYDLRGIHLQAHLALADAFGGDPFYGKGIDYLFDVELGRRGMLRFLEFTGTLLLAVLCPPLAFVVGVASARAEYETATEREFLYQALIDPELVLTRAEVETDLFLARVGLALALLPEVGTVLRLGRSALRVGVRHGARAVVRAAPRFGAVLTRAWMDDLQRSLRRGIVVAVARELVTDAVMDAVAERILRPIVQELERERSVTGPAGGSAGAAETLARLRAETEAAGARP